MNRLEQQIKKYNKEYRLVCMPKMTANLLAALIAPKVKRTEGYIVSHLSRIKTGHKLMPSTYAVIMSKPLCCSQFYLQGTMDVDFTKEAIAEMIYDNIKTHFKIKPVKK